MSYFTQSNEIPFRVGSRRAFVNPPMGLRLQVTRDQFVYEDVADRTIRVNREALLDHYPIVVRELAQKSGVPEAEAHAALQRVIHPPT